MLFQNSVKIAGELGRNTLLVLAFALLLYSTSIKGKQLLITSSVILFGIDLCLTMVYHRFPMRHFWTYRSTRLFYSDLCACQRTMAVLCLANGHCISAGGQGCFDMALAHGSAPKLSIIQQYLKGQAIRHKQSYEYVHSHNIWFTAFFN